MNITNRLPRSADCLIVGGGIIGAASAFYAQRAGLRTVILEKRPQLCTLTTPASTGAFRAQFDNPQEIALVQESIAVFENFAETVALKNYDIALQQQGYLWLTTTRAGAERQKQLVNLQHGLGLTDVELLSADEARRRFPYLAPEVTSARFRRRDGWLDVKKVTMGLAAASGATFCVEAPVTGFEIHSGKLKGVRTPLGNIACDFAIIAAGPFSGAVAALARLQLPLELRIRQKLVLPEVPEVPQNAPMTIDEDTGAHWRPAGGGAYVLFTNFSSAVTPPLEDVPTSADFYFSVLRPDSPNAVARISPFWRAPWQRNTCAWYLMAGQYTYTPDHQPLLGSSPITGLYLNCGYSGHGIMGSVGGSRLVVDTITGKVRAEQNPFRPDRQMKPKAISVL